jgi:hypothetical protein
MEKTMPSDSNRRADLLNSSAMRCIEWRPFVRNTLRGFATLRQRSGLIISDCTLHVKNGRWWVSPPGKPRLDANGVALRNSQTGKVDYVSIVTFADDELRRRWSDQGVEAVRRDFPKVFEPELVAGSGGAP